MDTEKQLVIGSYNQDGLQNSVVVQLQNNVNNNGRSLIYDNICKLLSNLAQRCRNTYVIIINFLVKHSSFFFEYSVPVLGDDLKEYLKNYDYEQRTASLIEMIENYSFDDFGMLAISHSIFCGFEFRPLNKFFPSYTLDDFEKLASSEINMQIQRVLMQCEEYFQGEVNLELMRKVIPRLLKELTDQFVVKLVHSQRSVFYRTYYYFRDEVDLRNNLLKRKYFLPMRRL